MEFLYRLYSNDYFGIGLFIVITVLAFSFLVILFFGKKDEKARSAEIVANKNNEDTLLENSENKNNSESNNTLEAIKIPNKEESIDLVESLEEKEEKIIISDETSLGTHANEDTEDNNFISDIFTLNSTPEEAEEDALFSFNTKEESVSEDSVMEEEEKDFMPFTPVIEESVSSNIFTEKKVEEAVKRPTMPTQFSSVYLHGNKEETMEKERKQEELKHRPTPVKPEFELPKKIELPKLNKETGNSHNDNIISPMLKEKKDEGLNNIFDNLEEESYTIDK